MWYHNLLSSHLGIKQTSTQSSRLSFRKSCMVSDALTTRQAEPPLVQQETHSAEHTLCLGACACAAITGKRTEDVTYWSPPRAVEKMSSFVRNLFTVEIRVMSSSVSRYWVSFCSPLYLIFRRAALMASVFLCWSLKRCVFLLTQIYYFQNNLLV